MPIDYQAAYARMGGHKRLAAWRDELPARVAAALNPERHGHLAYWLDVLEQLPSLPNAGVDLASPTIRVGPEADAETRQRLTYLLQQFHPWRKGPFNLHGVPIDTEWRSDWKWQRLENAIAPLAGRRVLDVGCGNGYHCWRMVGAGAADVIGIDPTLTSVIQFHALRHFFGAEWPVAVLPLGIEAVPPRLQAFDSVFSMGVLYHRRSPLDHLLELRACLAPGGELILETLVIEGENSACLVPEDRYARMRNVWFIPSPLTLQSWLKRCGFRHIRLIDVTPTTPAEQRRTDWMTFESLSDSLDPNDPQRTVEGLPAPLRAIFIAESP